MNATAVKDHGGVFVCIFAIPKKDGMKVMKFGGTSVGKPERMHEVAKLITADPEKKIVVLSALSGTTNALVEIGQSAARFEREKAGEQISRLSSHYHTFIEQLLETEKSREQA